jgi:hypothetical protein|tara:strand:- start:705 stop:884 length:180 start_codon:yes stop_codon:yes gene_type:complete
VLANERADEFDPKYIESVNRINNKFQLMKDEINSIPTNGFDANGKKSAKTGEQIMDEFK